MSGVVIQRYEKFKLEDLGVEFPWDPLKFSIEQHKVQPTEY